MKFSSKRIRLFGLSLTIPVLYFVAARLKAAQAEREHAAVLRGIRQELADCTRCHTILAARGGHSFYKHLEKDHKIEAEKLYELVSDIYQRLYQATCVAKAKQ